MPSPAFNLGTCYPLVEGQEALVRRHFMAVFEASDKNFGVPRPPRGDEADIEALNPLLVHDGVPAEVTLTPSGQSALAAAFLALCPSPGTHIAVEEWSYPNALKLLRRLGAIVSILPMDKHGLRPDALESAARAGAKILYTTPTMHNPTGITMPASRREEIASVVRRFGMGIVEDEAYAFLEGSDVRPLQALVPENTIRMVSLSKTLSLSLRLGAVVCPPAFTNTVVACMRMTGGLANPIMSAVAAGLVREGAVAGLIETKRLEGLKRQGLAQEILGEAYAGNPMGWYGMLSVPMAGSIFAERARQAGVTVGVGAEYRADGADVPVVRVSLGAEASRERLGEGLAILARIRGHDSHRAA